eukprot:TRINITY_DN3171_c3_g2_i1.p2 TRINITY_DN3171_c3_g2~~TRINITY_DN3171_c3_g2_i1.p2  ORF type:complete len:67 (-),score=12.58 TRINITY_DN3171_c3_g2_i1:673-873(-)
MFKVSINFICISVSIHPILQEKSNETGVVSRRKKEDLMDTDNTLAISVYEIVGVEICQNHYYINKL